MRKSIDADAFYQQEWVRCGMYEPMVGVENIKGGRETSYRTLRSRLKQAPAVDAVAIIRCENCDLWNAWDKHGNLCSCAHFTQDDATPVYTKPDDFCSYAEKK